MIDVNAAGREYDPFTFHVDRAKIKELCLAIGDNNPIYFDAEAAKKSGYKDTPAPLTFPTLMNFWGYPEIWDRMKEIGVDVKRLLHAAEEYEYFSPIYPGDTVTGHVKVDSVRSGGAMDVATFQTTFNKGDEIMLVARMKIVVISGGE